MDTKRLSSIGYPIRTSLMIALTFVLLPGFPTAAGQGKVCEKASPVEGTVTDPDWSFSYTSWVEPYAQNALRYFYSFTNRTNHNVPVRWDDANIVEVRTIPAQPITTSRVDVTPVGMRDSTIVVGGQGAGQKRYPLRNCFANLSKDVSALYQRVGTSARFAGRVARGDSAEGVLINVGFRSDVNGPEVNYSAQKQLGPKLSLYWNLPFVDENVVTLDPAVKFLSAKRSSSYALKAIDTLAVVSDAETKETLVVLRVPVTGYVRK